MTVNVPDYSTMPPRPRRFRWRNVAIMLAIILAVFILFCSGLPFPIIGGARSDLDKKLFDDFGLQLPSNAVVEHGARIALRDESYCYVLRLPPNQIVPFIDSIRGAAASKSIPMKDDALATPFGDEPRWFTPTVHPDVITFEVDHLPERSWIWSYSPSTGKVYIEWATY